jgi:hypothetical protein
MRMLLRDIVPVFLFGRLRRWTRDRGCELAHLTKFFARVGERGQ